MPLGTDEIELIGKRIDEAVRKISERLDRTDNQLDTLSEKVQSLTEQMTRQGCRLDGVEGMFGDHESRIRRLEATNHRTSVLYSGVVKVTGWIVAGAVGLAYWLMRNGSQQ